TCAPLASESQADSTSDVRRRYGAMRLRAAKTSARSTREDVRQLLRERGSREHFADTALPRGIDDLRVHVRNESERRHVRERLIGLHRSDDVERRSARIVEVEDDERWRRLLHLGDR